jgi:hypothetical protein
MGNIDAATRTGELHSASSTEHGLNVYLGVKSLVSFINFPEMSPNIMWCRKALFNEGFNYIRRWCNFHLLLQTFNN